MNSKIIWQTYETDFKDIIPEAKKCINTWIKNNPHWEYRYMSAKDRDDFVFKYFDKEWYELFINCNLNIVKANIWRCMVLYIYGGVYADLDSICNKPVESWIKNEYSMTVAKDDDGNSEDYCINVFSAKPFSSALHDILSSIKNNLKNNTITKDSVISLTGEGVWSNIITGQEERYGIYCYKKGSNIFNGNAVKHLGTFKDWHKKGYSQWTKENV